MPERTERRQIGEALLKDLIDDLSKNEYIALLGPRKGGKKSLVLDKVVEIISFRPLRDRPMIARLPWRDFRDTDEQTFLDKLAGILEKTTGQKQNSERVVGERLSGAVERMIKHALIPGSQVPMWLFIEDVVAFPRSIARQLLEALQSTHQTETRNRLAVVATGSSDFIPLTYGQNSPFVRAKKYIVQGLDKEFAAEYVRKRLPVVYQQGDASTEIQQSVFDLRAEVFDVLYGQTNGDPRLISDVLAGTRRHPFDSNTLGAPSQWNVADFNDVLQKHIDLHMPDDFSLRSELREVEADDEAFDLLLRVLRDGDAVVQAMHVDPEKMEVSGLLGCNGANKYEIQCLLLRRYMTQALSPRHIADVYAMQGRWDNAWVHYTDMQEGERDRPVSGEARMRLRDVISNWQNSLLEKAHEGTYDIVRHFLNGMRHLFGFNAGGLYNPETFDWKQYPCDLKPPPSGPPPLPANAVICDQSAKRHLSMDSIRARLWCGSDRGSRPPGSTPHWLYLERAAPGWEIDANDARKLSQVVNQFWDSFETAQNIEYRQQVGILRDSLLQVIGVTHEAVNEALMQDVFDMGNVVSKAGDALVDIAGYFRIQICLVNAERTRIQAVKSKCSNPEQNMEDSTDLELPVHGQNPSDESLSAMDVQPWVVVMKQTVIRDARSKDQRNPTVRPPVAKEMKAIAVVPMLVDDEVIGTIHLERKDKAPMNAQEVELVEGFARQIGFVFNQAQRIVLLQGALHAIDDPIRIISPDFRNLFQNKKLADQRRAAGDTEVRQGWQDGTEIYSPKLYFKWVRTLQQLPIEASSENTEPDHQYLTNKEEFPDRACDLQRALITDFRGDHLEPPFTADGRIGILEATHDLTRLFQLLKSIEHWLNGENAKDSATRILETFHQLGHRWGRIYLLKHIDEDHAYLESFEQRGLHEPENVHTFQTGGVILKRELNKLAWHAIDTQEPAIYEFDLDLRPEATGAVRLDERGFPRYKAGLIETPPVLERDNTGRDRIWVEAPLQVGKNVVGIVSLAARDEDFRSAEWETFKLSVQNAALVLQHALLIEEKQEEQARLANERERLTNEQSELVTNVRHSFSGPVEVLSMCFEEIDGLVSNDASINLPIPTPILNDMRDMTERLKRASEEYQMFTKEYEPSGFVQPGDIVQRIQQVKELASKIDPSVLVTVRAPKQGIMIESDLEEIERAVVELVRNARTAEAKNITIACKYLRGQLEILVQDDGNGIREPERIFEPNFTTSSETTGLGLTNRRKRIRKLGGDIVLQSWHRGDKRFLLHLPIKYDQLSNRRTANGQKD